MTALPGPPVRPLTVAEYAALPEDGEIRYELEEGLLVMSPSPVLRHQRALYRLATLLEPQMPDGTEFILDTDLDLQLVEPHRPGFVRRPDLVVVMAEAVAKAEHEGTLLQARDALLVVEIISPGSRRRDTVTKHGEYADAGIPHYWIVDLDDRPSLIACHRAGEFGYADAPPVTGTFTTEDPFPVRLDLDRLV
jgi:Uma2 family endonuclease